MIEVRLTEFRKEVRKYFEIAEKESVQIKRGKVVYELKSVQNLGDNGKKSVQIEDKPVQIPKQRKEEYGCGCEREGGKVLCGKHGRY